MSNFLGVEVTAVSCRRTACVAAFASAGALALSLAPSASAAVTCEFQASSETLFVRLTADADEVRLTATGGAAIRVIDRRTSAISDCDAGGGDPTRTNTDRIIVTHDAGVTNTIVAFSDPASLGPGETTSGDPSGVNEIETTITFGGGTQDKLILMGTTGADDWRLGSSGLNWNPVTDSAPDTDVFLSAPRPDIVEVFPETQDDVISGRGGAGAGGPVTGSLLTLVGQGGNDTLEGGDFASGSGVGDGLAGQAGNDVVRGFAGNDTIVGTDPGDDTFDGGAGSGDTIGFAGAVGGAMIDLGQTSPQATGQGTDTVSGFENALGSAANDTLIGNGASNLLSSGNGDDLIDGRGGPDVLVGDSGIDTASYQTAPSEVAVDLSGPTSGTATGGAGEDSLFVLENIIGSPFADTLTGNGLGNSITGLGGNDTISALAGPDAVDVRDGGPDTAGCGSEIDTATADQSSLDSVNADCETVDFLPEPDPGDGGGDGGGGGPVDNEIAFKLAGKAKQRVLKQKGVVVRVRCPLEDCTATASGKGKVPRPRRSPRAKLNLKPVTETLAAGVAEKVKLRLKKKQRRAIAAALRAGKKPRVKVSASVIDGAGNAATDKLTVTAKR
jgi:Ca2+-binding RTX toxin-like protein